MLKNCNCKWHVQIFSCSHTWSGVKRTAAIRVRLLSVSLYLSLFLSLSVSLSVLLLLPTRTGKCRWPLNLQFGNSKWTRRTPEDRLTFRQSGKLQLHIVTHPRLSSSPTLATWVFQEPPADLAKAERITWFQRSDNRLIQDVTRKVG